MSIHLSNIFSLKMINEEEFDISIKKLTTDEFQEEVWYTTNCAIKYENILQRLNRDIVLPTHCLHTSQTSFRLKDGDVLLLCIPISEKATENIRGFAFYKCKVYTQPPKKFKPIEANLPSNPLSKKNTKMEIKSLGELRNAIERIKEATI